MSQPILTIGGQAFGAFEVAVFAGLVAVGLALLLAWRAARARAEVEAQAVQRTTEFEAQIEAFARSQAELNGRLQAMAETLGERQSDVQRAVNERLDSVTHRLGQSMLDATRYTSEHIAKLNERLGIIDVARQSIGELASEVGGLKSILANKQARGAFGQTRMEAIVSDGLPNAAYAFQVTLSNGKRPDCVIRLPNTPEVLVIDAKFPLEAVSASRQAESPEEKRAALQRLKVDVARHIDDIAEKYLLPGETQDLALMFVPSESVFAELHEGFEDLMQKAFRQRVVLVSPSLLMMAIQVMQALVRDQRMRDEARLIQIEVGHLLEDVRRLRERSIALQRHFGQVGEDVGSLLVSADKIMKRGARIEAVELEDTPVLPKAEAAE